MLETPTRFLIRLATARHGLVLLLLIMFKCITERLGLLHIAAE